MKQSHSSIDPAFVEFRANLEFTYLLINFYFGFTLNSASLIYMCRAVGSTFFRVCFLCFIC